MSNRYRKDGCILHINNQQQNINENGENLGGPGGFLEPYRKNRDKIDGGKFSDNPEGKKTKKKPWKNQGITFLIYC